MTKYQRAMLQINEWIAEAAEDDDAPLERGLRQARDVLKGYSKLSGDDAPHNVQVMKQYNALVAMAMRNSSKLK